MTSLDKPTEDAQTAAPEHGPTDGRRLEGGDRGRALRGVRRRPGHGRDDAPGPALRHDLHDQQGPAQSAIAALALSPSCWSWCGSSRKDTVKHAFSGVFGVAFGVVFAMMTGNAKDFYLPGMLYTLGLGARLHRSRRWRASR